jgi:hypothetical protein
MHQIIRGISVLNTGGGGGSITRGTSAVISNEPLDLSMDVVLSSPSETDHTTTINYQTPASAWCVPTNFYEIRQINLSPAQQVRHNATTPPASPNLCIIQEENSPAIAHQPILVGDCDISNYQQQLSHPQICLTDVQGSEITLVALSDSSCAGDSEDSLDGQHQTTSFQGLVISEPSSDMPSITRGVGRKASLENENNYNNHQQPHHSNMKLETNESSNYQRRGSDKSLGFSDDSLSNDSNHSNLSPVQEQSAMSASSGFKSAGDSSHQLSDLLESRLSPDSLCESRSDEYELPLPHGCVHLDTTRILELVKKTIDSKMPPKGCVLNNNISSSAMPSTSNAEQTNNLSLEYSGGLQIELQVCEGKNKDSNGGKGIKVRRISGDQNEYGKLCQQLITSLTV